MNKNDESTPIINYIFNWTDEEMKNLQDELMEMYRHTRPTVTFHKNKLDKQTYTWIGEYRYWVWEGNNWRVYCSNKKGTCFEVAVGLSKPQVIDA